MDTKEFLQNAEQHGVARRAPTQQQVLRALSLLPGASPAEVQQLTGRGWGSVDHALYTLCRQRQVRVVAVGKKRRFFLAGHEAAAAFLLPRPLLRVLHAIRVTPLATTVDLARLTGMDKAEVSRAAAALADEHWIERMRDGRRVLHFAVGLYAIGDPDGSQ